MVLILPDENNSDFQTIKQKESQSPVLKISCYWLSHNAKLEYFSPKNMTIFYSIRFEFFFFS